MTPCKGNDTKDSADDRTRGVGHPVPTVTGPTDRRHKRLKGLDHSGQEAEADDHENAAPPEHHTEECGGQNSSALAIDFSGVELMNGHPQLQVIDGLGKP